MLHCVIVPHKAIRLAAIFGCILLLTTSSFAQRKGKKSSDKPLEFSSCDLVVDRSVYAEWGVNAVHGGAFYSDTKLLSYAKVDKPGGEFQIVPRMPTLEEVEIGTIVLGSTSPLASRNPKQGCWTKVTGKAPLNISDISVVHLQYALPKVPALLELYTTPKQLFFVEHGGTFSFESAENLQSTRDRLFGPKELLELKKTDQVSAAPARLWALYTEIGNYYVSASGNGFVLVKD
ncbi:MAG: hypothetical protein V1495_04395 [Pseudomonadota bacterium]